jgi:hypothetical protein
LSGRQANAAANFPRLDNKQTLRRRGQYKFRPIRVEPHQRMRVWVLDAGPSDLQPAQGGFVEFSFDEPGLYPIVTHKFANVAKGALGLFQAGDVKASGAGH